jgi:hypothetical protein
MTNQIELENVVVRFTNRALVVRAVDGLKWDKFQWVRREI